jgi:hypothetical protein
MPVTSQKKLIASIASAHTIVSSGPIDICKTPAPPAPAPVPLPYPNVAVTATPGPGYATKTLTLSTPAYTKKSKTAISNGDQPGVAMGIISSRIMGMCGPTMTSNDVEIETGGVVRALDSGESNMGSQSNSKQHTVLAPGLTAIPADPNSAICKAYCRALRRWEKEKPHKPPDFTSYVAQELKKLADQKKIGQGLANSLIRSRERVAGVIFRNNVVGNVSSLAAGGGPLAGMATTAAQNAGAITTAIGTGLGTVARLDARTAAVAAFGGTVVAGGKFAFGGLLRAARAGFPSTVHPDFTNPTTGNPMEVKRPGEGQSNPNQLKNEAKCSPNGQVELVDDKNCGC